MPAESACGGRDSRRASIEISVCAYLPHSWAKDEEFDAVCAELEYESRKEGERGAVMVIGGDFNAEIGLRQPGEDDAVIGLHGAGSAMRWQSGP